VTFFDVAKKRCCKQSGYDDQIIENSKKSQILRAGRLCTPLLTLILLEERPLREIRGAKPDSRGGCLSMVSPRA
jgi:hypothetical protein